MVQQHQSSEAPPIAPTPTSSSNSHMHTPPVDIAQDKSEIPQQPTSIQFPIREYGGSSKRRSSFQVSWYNEFPWIEYSIERDAVFCFPCRFFGVAPDNSLTLVGFCDWKHAKGKSGTLTSHDRFCSKHHDAVLSWQSFKSSVSNNSSVVACMSRGRQKTVEENRAYVRAILESILYLCQQGLPLRGHREVLDTDDTSTNVGNFRSLVVLLSRSNEVVKNRLTSGPRNATWLGHHIQNSLISLLASSVQEMIKSELRSAQYFTLIADETKDVSKTEQLSVVLRYVYQCKTYERFISYSQCDELNSEAIFNYIMTALTELDVDISNCVSQCFDGASVMSGCHTGVKAKINEVNPTAVYIHCYAHQLNLALVDTCKQLAHAFDFFSLLESVYVFISSSVPHAIFINKQKELHFNRLIQLKQLSNTRWSCRHSSIQAVLSTYTVLIATLEEISDTRHDRSVQARGLLHQVKIFPFLLSLVLFEKVFSITNSLSNLLQAEHISYAAVASCIKATKTTLSDLRSEAAWRKVWDQAISIAEKNGLSVTPRRPRRTPIMSRQLDGFIVDSASASQRATCTEDYRTQVYYSTLDILLQEMNNRFSELNLSLLTALEALVPNSDLFLSLSTLSPFLLHYGIDELAMEAEASVVKAFLCDRDPNLCRSSNSLHKAYQLLSEVPEGFPATIKCYQIALTIGVSSATAERSFSSLRRIKTYLRSTMSQIRLSNLALLYIERDLSSNLWNQIDDLVIKFAEAHNNSRIALF